MSIEPVRRDQPIIPPVPQPKGKAYYFGTWSGRILLTNALVFVAMAVVSAMSGEDWVSLLFLLPDPSTLLWFGAKDPVGLAHGEIWRFLTPIFVHIGIIHFAFNSIGIYVIGYQLERLLGSAWFLLIYMSAGIVGNISSAIFTVAVSAGASGALFGLLGCGYVLERTVGEHVERLTGQRPRRGIYAGMVFINILFGVLIPGIDNAAHIGGLVTGALLTYVMTTLRQNRLRPKNIPLGVAISIALLCASVGGAVVGTNKDYVVHRLESAADKAEFRERAYHFYSQGLEIDPKNIQLRLKRGRILLFAGEFREGMQDLEVVALDPNGKRELEALAAELEGVGLNSAADAVRMLLIEYHL